MQIKRFDEFSFTFGSNMLTVSSLREFSLNRDIKYMLKLSTRDNSLACYSLVEYSVASGCEDLYTEVNIESSPEMFLFVKGEEK